MTCATCFTAVLFASVAIADLVPIAPIQPRHFAKTVHLAEIPLAHPYSNGNIWTGYAHRWTDWPLMIDRSLPYFTGRPYQMSVPDLRRTLDEMRDGGMDGATFNASLRSMAQLVNDIAYGDEPPPVRLVSDYQPIALHYNGGNWRVEDQDWYAPAMTNRFGLFHDGRPVIVAYTDRMTPDGAKERLKLARQVCGDFLFLPFCNLGSSMSDWTLALRQRRPVPEHLKEKAREHIRSYLRVSDGVQICCNHFDAVSPEYDEGGFDANFFRRYYVETFREVYNEPEFKGKKLLGIVVGMGHANSYTFGNKCSSNGTRTLRDSLATAYDLQPDIITFFEWDEWNENTGIRPSLYNSFAPRRIVRAMRARHEGRPNEVLPGDDTAIPNLIFSCRKTLALGEAAQYEILSVPDTSSCGQVTVTLALEDENGRRLKSFAPVTLNTGRMEERRLIVGSETFGDSCAVIPVLTVTSPSGTRTWSEGLPFTEIRPTTTWDHKWALMPLRDLAAGGSCSIREIGVQDGKVRMEAKATLPEGIDRLELLDGGDIVYSKPGSDVEEWREDDTHYVFEFMQVVCRYPRKNASLEVRGVTDAEWMIATNRTRGLACPLVCQGQQTPDTYLRIRKDEATRAVVKLSWPEIGTYEIPLDKVVRSGVYSVSGPYALSFTAHRFMRQTVFFSPVGAVSATASAEVIPDLPVSVLSAHAITEKGKIFRSRPVVVGRRTEERVPVRVWSTCSGKMVTVMVDRSRVPVMDFDISGEKTGKICPSGFGWPFNGVAGGFLASATRRNRGSDSVQHSGLGNSRQWMKEPVAPVQVRIDGTAALEFDGSGTYFALPAGVLSRTAAYRLSFEFKTDDEGREQELFSAGSPVCWGSIAYLRIGTDGRLYGLGLSQHEYEDTDFMSVSPVRKGWNTVELIHNGDGIRLVLNGERSPSFRAVPPGRFDCPCWFGGRKDRLFKGWIRNIRCSHIYGDTGKY